MHRIRGLLGGLWSLLAVVLVLLAVWYWVLELIVYAGWSAPGRLDTRIPITLQLPLILVILAILYIVEGAEIAVTGLLDKDPEQVPEGKSGLRDLLKNLRADPEIFFSGRQLLVVASVVTLTALAGMLSAVTGPPLADGDRIGRLLWWPTKSGFSAAYAFVMPIFVVLWFAQLLPKFLAQANPIGALGTGPTQWLVKLSSVFGGTFEIGAPSVWLKKLLRRNSVESGADELGPSRDAHYKSSAILRYGRGLESFKKRLEIGQGGKICSTTEIVYKAFKTEFNREYAFNEWWLASITEAMYEIVKKPDGCEISAKRVFSDARKDDGTAVERGAVNLRFGLTTSVPVGKTFEYKITCSTAPNATEHEFGSRDYYTHKVTVPTKRLIFEIVPAAGTKFLLMNGACKSELSNEPQANDDESRRVRIINGFEQRGCRFEMDYLLEGTELRFDWILEEQAESKG